jgi:multidrug efflux pump subunit AcrA (membrane-fusion protein)
VEARHGVVLLPDAEAMEVEVGPSKADLQDKVQVGQGAVGSDEKAPPEHRVNVPDPDVDQVSFDLGMLFHGGVSLPAGQRLGSF